MSRSRDRNPGKWLAAEKERLARLGLESGQRFLFHFDRDPRKDWVENLGRFERPARSVVTVQIASVGIPTDAERNE